jgi:hypothetical protein
MFKVIGGVVICGFALYGLVKYLERPLVKVVINAERFRTPESAVGEAGEDEAPPSAGDSAPEPTSDTELMPAAA